MKVYCFSPFGYEGSLVSIEVDLRRGIPATDIIGLADSAVRESRERMKSAIINSGLEFPCERVLISLSPADIKKEGAGFDLAVALAVLCEKNSVQGRDSILIMGELELNGKVRPVRSIHAAVSTAHSHGINYCIVPKENKNEAASVIGMKVFGADTLIEAFNALSTGEVFFSPDNDVEYDENKMDAVVIDSINFPKVENGFDFKDVKNQGRLVRALQIAAAGGHNLLAFGPPGCGKTLSLQKFPSLLPLLTVEQAQTVTRIHSIAGLIPPGKSLIQKRPFRMPHQTATVEGICGGGPHCLPGEVSLSHNGTLFLDEASEFRTSVLQMLRVPLECSTITLSRAGRTTIFPADFQLLLSTNPCPCGNYGSSEKVCLCSARAVEMYWKKFSGPLLDRIDLRVQVETHSLKLGEEEKISRSTDELRKEIARAIKIQRKRQEKSNAKLMASEINVYCKMTDEAREYLNHEAERNELSPRGCTSCIKVCRTISDMKGMEILDLDSMKEAVSFRKNTGAMEMFK